LQPQLSSRRLYPPCACCIHTLSLLRSPSDPGQCNIVLFLLLILLLLIFLFLVDYIPCSVTIIVCKLCQAGAINSDKRAYAQGQGLTILLLLLLLLPLPLLLPLLLLLLNPTSRAICSFMIMSPSIQTCVSGVFFYY
jgi:hypothetical protein